MSKQTDKLFYRCYRKALSTFGENLIAFMGQHAPPKRWKFALLVWCFIYPVITVFSMTLLPLMSSFAAPFRTLSMSLILAPVMAYFYIPYSNKRFFDWLRK